MDLDSPRQGPEGTTLSDPADFVRQANGDTSNRFSSIGRDCTIMSASPIEETGEDFELNNSAEEMLAKMMNQTFNVNICGRKV
jgi:hypothetical protein